MFRFKSLAGFGALTLCLSIFPSTVRADEGAAAEGDRVVGNISYSNQWKTDLNKSYLYFELSRQTFGSSGLNTGLYNTNFSNEPLWMPTLHYVSRLFHIGSETGERWNSFAVDGHYSLGFGFRQADLYNTYSDSAVSDQRASLAMMSIRVGPALSYERFEFFKPFFSVTAAPFAFRQSAAVDGAETDGGGWTMNTAIGAQINPPFLSGLSGLVEYRHSKPVTDNNQLLSEGSDLDLGVGYVF